MNETRRFLPPQTGKTDVCVCLLCFHRLSLPDTALGKTAPQTCRFPHIWCFHSKLIYLIYFPFFVLHHKLLAVTHFHLFPSLSHALNSDLTYTPVGVKPLYVPLELNTDARCFNFNFSFEAVAVASSVSLARVGLK